MTGAAKYAAEFNVAGLAYGVVVSSTIARGRITKLDDAAALAAAGRDPRLLAREPARRREARTAATATISPRRASPFRPLYDNEIKYSGQPVALVVAESFELARHAAALVRIEYEREPHATDLDANLEDRYVSRERGRYRPSARSRAATPTGPSPGPP